MMVLTGPSPALSYPRARRGYDLALTIEVRVGHRERRKHCLLDECSVIAMFCIGSASIELLDQLTQQGVVEVRVAPRGARLEEEIGVGHERNDVRRCGGVSHDRYDRRGGEVIT